MPTNRKRKMRTSKRRIPAKITEEYLGSLRVKLFLDEFLTEEELAIVIPYDREKTDAYLKALELAGEYAGGWTPTEEEMKLESEKV